MRLVIFLLTACISLRAWADAPKAEDYVAFPESLPTLEQTGGPFAVKLDPKTVSLATAAGFPAASFAYGLWVNDANGNPECVDEKAIRIQVLDSSTYATVNRMQHGGPLRRCFEPIVLHLKADPARAIDAFLAKASPGCPFGQLMIIAPGDKEDRFVVTIEADHLGEIPPKKFQEWLQATGALLDLKKLSGLPSSKD